MNLELPRVSLKDSLVLRFTAPVTSLGINEDHTLMGAGSRDFSVKVLELESLPSSFSLMAHETFSLSRVLPTRYILVTVLVHDAIVHLCIQCLEPQCGC